MSSYSVLKASFQYGEISPFFGGQVGSEIYAAGVKEMKNVLPDMAGGFRKRNGTVYFPSPDPTLRTRLFEFFTGADSFLLAMNTSNTYLYDSKDPFTVLCSTTTPYDTWEKIEEVKVRANKGILYLVQKDTAPQTLTITITGTPPTYSMAFAAISFIPSGQFGSAGDYPSALCFKGGRLFLAATDNHPTTVWASRVPDDNDRYNDFTLYDDLYIPTVDTSVVSNKKYYTKTYNAQGEAVLEELRETLQDLNLWQTLQETRVRILIMSGTTMTSSQAMLLNLKKTICTELGYIGLQSRTESSAETREQSSWTQGTSVHRRHST